MPISLLVGVPVLFVVLTIASAPAVPRGRRSPAAALPFLPNPRRRARESLRRRPVSARRRRVRGLLVLGSPRAELLRAHAATTAVPLALLALLSVAGGWLVARVMEFRDDRTAVPSLFYLQLAGLSLAGILTVVTSPFLLRALSDDELRQE